VRTHLSSALLLYRTAPCWRQLSSAAPRPWFSCLNTEHCALRWFTVTSSVPFSSITETRIAYRLFGNMLHCLLYDNTTHSLDICHITYICDNCTAHQTVYCWQPCLSGCCSSSLEQPAMQRPSSHRHHCSLSGIN